MLARVSASAARSGLARPMVSALASRPATLCSDTGVQVDMVCRVWTCKVKDDSTAHDLDCAFDEMIDAVADIEGCAGASRLVCKSDWDYKFILKFENLDSMQDFMANDHARVMDVHLPRIKSLAVDSKVHEQNFVYDDIE